MTGIKEIRSRATPPGWVSFVVEGNPRPKGRPVTRFRDGSVRTFTPRPTVDWENKVAWAAHQAMDGLEPFQEEVGIELHFYRRVRHVCDFDNLAKAVLDAIQERPDSPGGIVLADDSQVVEAHIYKEIDPARPRVEVRVWDLSARCQSDTRPERLPAIVPQERTIARRSQ